MLTLFRHLYSASNYLELSRVGAASCGLARSGSYRCIQPSLVGVCLTRAAQPSALGRNEEMGVGGALANKDVQNKTIPPAQFNAGRYCGLISFQRQSDMKSIFVVYYNC